MAKQRKRGFSRRSFIKTVVAGGVSATVVGGLGNVIPSGKDAPISLDTPVLLSNSRTSSILAYATAQPSPERSEIDTVDDGYAGRSWVMVIDLSKCNGCRDCTAACDRFHFTPPGQEWVRVFSKKDSGESEPYWFVRPCMHCDNPPCAKVCPVGATYKRADGIVMQDQERCIGCRFCIAACPYQARYFNWEEPPHYPEEVAATYSVEKNYPHRLGVVEKCILCPGNAREGELPACVDACPMGAFYFGDTNEDAVTNSFNETVPFTKLLKDGAAYRDKEDLGTEPRVYYLPPRARKYASPPQARRVD